MSQTINAILDKNEHNLGIFTSYLLYLGYLNVPRYISVLLYITGVPMFTTAYHVYQ